MGLLKKLGNLIEDITDDMYEIHLMSEAASTEPLTGADRAYREKLLDTELESRMESVIYKLHDMNADPELIKRLWKRHSMRIYEYEDLLKQFGYDPYDFNITKIEEDYFDTGRWGKQKLERFRKEREIKKSQREH